AMVVAPLDLPPVRPGFGEPTLDALLVSEIRYAEEVAPPRSAGHGIQEGEEPADRTPDGEDVAMFPAVDGITTNGIEVVMRKVHNGFSPSGERLHQVCPLCILLAIT